MRGLDHQGHRLREGRYDHGTDEYEDAVRFAQRAQVRAAFAKTDWLGAVLEVADGTSIWTDWLAD